MSRTYCHALAALLLAAGTAFPAAGAPAPDFDRSVAPLLAGRCLGCHSGASPKGGLDLSRKKSAAKALTPHRPDDSPLWQRVADDEMPPKKPLSPAEKALLRAWVAGGARWGRDPIDPFRFTSSRRAGLDWWALRPPGRPAPPRVGGGWARNPIDAFVLAGLRARGLTPSPGADRRALVRRASFDLLGLPPSPTTVRSFLADRSPGAYERLIDRLLASPAYGERWGRHWLDVVRFGESDGFERDLPRPAAWPYRDWVVAALNADLPYDEFVRLQLAGDVVRPGDPAALAATGFLVAGPHDIVVPASEAMKAAQRQDELEDVIGVVGQTFLGLTVHCARCHDHKFDPVSQKDYYRLVASLDGVGFGERALPAGDAAALARLRARRDRIDADLAALEAPVRQRLLAGQKPAGPAAPRPLAAWDFTAGLQDAVGGLHARLRGSARRADAGVVLDGKAGFAATPPLAHDLREKTLEVRVRLDGLAQRGGAAVGVQTLDGRVFDAVVFGEQEPGRWMAGSDNFARTRSFAGPAETEAGRRFVHLAVVWGGDGRITAYRDGAAYGKAYRAGGPALFPAGRAQVVFGLRHGVPGGNRLLAGVVRSARLYDRALSAREVAAAAGAPYLSGEEVRGALAAADRRRHDALARERDRVAAQLARAAGAPVRKIYAVVPRQPGPTRVLLRGSVTAPGEPALPEPISALAGRTAAARLPANAPEGARRVALGRWVTAADNPLFARVIVNRLWHHHFGVGLVDTPNDFGFNGGRPSHPELLDFLANELVRHGWRLKPVHRLILLSATYQQSSRPRPQAARVDADNRLLWRKSPARLEAEAVRDAMLAAAGVLDRRVGGAPYLDVRSHFFKGTQFYEPLEQVGPAFARRSLYRLGARGGRDPFLDTFDCPDPSTPTPRRAVTTTPLQALALLNNAQVLHLAQQMAERLRVEAGADEGGQVRLAYLLAYGRPPRADEVALVGPFVRRYGLAAFCRVVFNSNEFVRVD
jgi:hypothetical protein